jgi:hypothetical protein
MTSGCTTKAPLSFNRSVSAQADLGVKGCPTVLHEAAGHLVDVDGQALEQ